MLIVATTVFLYYTIWTLVMVCRPPNVPSLPLNISDLHASSPLSTRRTLLNPFSLLVFGPSVFPSSSFWSEVPLLALSCPSS